MQKVIISLLTFLCAGCATQPTSQESTKGTDGFQVWYANYTAKKEPALKRTVLILPPTGGVTYLEKSYATALAKKGANVKVLQKWTGMTESYLELDLHQKLHKRAMMALREVIKTCPKDHKISLMGTSVGGLFAAVAASDIDAIDRVLAIAGGSPIPELIVNSDYSTMKDLRERRFKKFDFKNREEYLEALDKRFFLNPHKMPKKFKNKHLGIVVLLKDKAVPTLYQKQLKQLWQPEFVRELDESHLFGIIKTWWFFSNDIENFLIDEPKKS